MGWFTMVHLQEQGGIEMADEIRGARAAEDELFDLDEANAALAEQDKQEKKARRRKTEKTVAKWFGGLSLIGLGAFFLASGVGAPAGGASIAAGVAILTGKKVKDFLSTK